MVSDGGVNHLMADERSDPSGRAFFRKEPPPTDGELPGQFVPFSRVIQMESYRRNLQRGHLRLSLGERIEIFVDPSVWASPSVGESGNGALRG